MLASRSDKYNKLNSLYLFLWECLDEFFEEGRWLSGAPARIPEIRISARQLSTTRELTSLKDIEALELRLVDRPRIKESAVERFQEVIAIIDKKLQRDFADLEHVGVTGKELEDAKQDGERVLNLVWEYAKLSSDTRPWVEKALDLKNELGRKALEYSAKLTDQP